MTDEMSLLDVRTTTQAFLRFLQTKGVEVPDPDRMEFIYNMEFKHGVNIDKNKVFNQSD